MIRLFAAVAAPVAALVAFLVAPMALMTLGGTGGSSTLAAAEQVGCTGGKVVQAAMPTRLEGDAERRNAQAIIAEGLRLGVPKRGLEIAIGTAMQESRMRADLDESESDRDSAGLFQQRAAWGPLNERMDPTLSARRFFTGGDAGQPGLLDITDDPNTRKDERWQSMSFTLAAQAVQRSAYPMAYAKWEPLAVRVVREALAGETLVNAPVSCRPAEALDATTDCLKVTDVVPPSATVPVRGNRLHRCLAPAVDRMFAQAARDGIAFGITSGYRSYEKQVQLRRAHCGPTHYDIYERPSGECSPETAIPGASMHERGLAVDLNVGGVTVVLGSPGHTWLVHNAAQYGLLPLNGEPWHWNTKRVEEAL